MEKISFYFILFLKDILQFQPFSSSIDVSFWYKLENKKLHEYKLSNDPQVKNKQNKIFFFYVGYEIVEISFYISFYQ